MTELIGEVFSKIFNDNVILATIFVSMIPIMELKGGIPFGMSKAFWRDNALSRWSAFGWAYLGCSIVVVGLYFAFVPIMKLLRKTKVFKGLANFIDNRVKSKSSKYQNQPIDNSKDVDQDNKEIVTTSSSSTKTKMLKLLGVFGFVAIPLPLTGVWMGVCMAVILGLKFFETFIFVQLGNLIAGIIISTICVMFPQFTHWLIYIFLILVAIVIIFEIIKHKINKNKSIKNN